MNQEYPRIQEYVPDAENPILQLQNFALGVDCRYKIKIKPNLQHGE